MSLSVPKSEHLHLSAQKVNDKLENVFSDARIENMFAEFEKRAKDGFVDPADFPAVLTALFDDAKHEQVALLLESKYFMERVFAFLDQGNKGKLNAADLERVGIMFSSETDDLITFRFAVYDVGHKGYITKPDMTAMIRATFETTLNIRERDLAELAKKDQTEEGALENFKKSRAQFTAKAELVDDKIAHAVGFAFETTVRKDSDRITAAEFATANKKNDDLFDWRGLADDLADYVDDMSRMV